MAAESVWWGGKVWDLVAPPACVECEVAFTVVKTIEGRGTSSTSVI